MKDDSDFNIQDIIDLPHTQRHLVDQLLLSIIWAYPGPKASDLSNEQRLSQAKAALFGSIEFVGRDAYDDRAALIHMARGYIKDRGGPCIFLGHPPGYYPEKYNGARTIAKLAEDAHHLAFGHIEQTKERLRKKFRKERKELLYLATHEDNVPELFTSQALELLQNALKRFGIETANTPR